VGLYCHAEKENSSKKGKQKTIGDKQKAKAMQRSALRRKGNIEELEDRSNEDFSQAAARIVREATEKDQLLQVAGLF
jgi:hypothetical protein